MIGIEIAGKIALVTGANRGIGKAIVEALMQQGIAKVYAAVRDVQSVAALVDIYADRLIPLTIDVSSSVSIQQAAEQAQDVNIVVNNAGVLSVCNVLDKNAPQNLEYELSVNVFGLLHMAQAFAPILKANGGGALVQLNSVASLRSVPHVATYAASKAAAFSLTTALAAELRAQGTHVLSIHPGPIESDMARQASLENTEPPSVVADALIEGLKQRRFQVYPDQRAQGIGQAFESYAQEIILPIVEGID